MKIVITGASSMMGSAVIRSLLRHKIDKIYAVVQPNSQNLSKIPDSGKIELIECDCSNYHRLADLITDDCDVFYHFAWIHSALAGRERYFDVEVSYRNIGQTLNALAAAAALKCKNFVGAGSQAEYGNRRELVQKAEDPSDPITAYAIAKDCARRMCMLKGIEYGIDVQWVRIFSVYGLHDRKNTLISSILPKLLNDEVVNLTDCTQIWDYLYEDDAAEGMFYVGQLLNKGSNVFCLGSGESKPLRAYIEQMKLITGSDSKINYGAIPHTGEAVMNLSADISKIKDMTKWAGPQVTFEEGIKTIIRQLSLST